MASTTRCPSCARRLRTPTHGRPGRLRCPACGHVWDWGDDTGSALSTHRQGTHLTTEQSPAQTEVEPAAEKWVSFRCAINAVKFTVGFGRHDADRRLSVVETVKETPGRRLDAFLGQLQKGMAVRNDVRAVAEFDFSNWCCPCCGYTADGGKSPFVHCGACDELVCGGGLRRTLLSRQRFTCHPLCGNSSKITGGIARIGLSEGLTSRALGQSSLPAPGRLLLPQHRK